MKEKYYTGKEGNTSEKGISFICFIPLIVHGSNRDFVLKYFEICFVMKVENCEDIMFCELNFEIMF